MEFPVRINKYLADKNIASRREADVLITKKQILINGVPAVVGQKVQANDQVEVKGTGAKKRYLAYYKGRGIITHSPAENETDIKTRLKQDYGITDIAPIGRLDKDSEGLLILTDDGRLTGPLLDSENDIEKEYTVTVDKNVTKTFAKLMELGVSIEGYRTKPAKVVMNLKNLKRFNLIITEGKKHQIRRMCAALGYQVETLKRVRVANIELKNLKPNQFRKIAGDELNGLMEIAKIK